MTRCSLTSNGSLGLVPHLPRYYEALRLLVPIPTSSVVPRQSVPLAPAVWVVPRQASLAPCLSRPGLGRPGRQSLCVPWYTLRLSKWRQEASQVPGRSMSYVPCSRTPEGRSGETTAPFRVAFRYVDSVGSLDLLLSRLNHTAHMLPVYASSLRSLGRDATLGYRWMVSPCRAGATPAWIALKGFSIYIAFSFPRLRLAHGG